MSQLLPRHIILIGLVSFAACPLFLMSCSRAPGKAEPPSTPSVVASAKRMDANLDVLPPAWALLRVKLDPAEKFFLRLPKVQGWMKKFEDLEKNVPEDEFAAEREKGFEGTDPEIAVAGSAKTLLKLIVGAVAPFPLPGPAEDFQAMARQLAQLELHRDILISPTEMANLTTRARRYDLAKNLPSAGEVGTVGGTPIFRFDLDFYAEPRPGVLIGGSHIDAIKQCLRKTEAGHKRAQPSFDYDALLHIPPGFLNEEIWPKLFQQDFLHENGKLVVSNVWVGARVLPDGLRIQVQAVIEDEGLRQKAQKALDAAPTKEDKKPFVKKTDIRMDGKNLNVLLEVEDGFVDQFLPTAEQIAQWLNFVNVFSKVLKRQ